MANFLFPKDLDVDIQPYMIFNAFSWKAKGISKRSAQVSTTQRVEDSITLPLPTNGIVDSISHNWEEGAGLGGSGIKDVLVHKLGAKGQDLIGDLGKYYTVRGGYLINDLASLAFTGTHFRNFEFSFTMIPKNVDESNMIDNIVKAFKRNSLPSYQQWKILYPNFWNIIIKFPEDRDIIRIKNCVITATNLSLFADDNSSIFTNGSPHKTELSISLTELQKLDRSDFV
jgi:hypothetical protein